MGVVWARLSPKKPPRTPLSPHARRLDVVGDPLDKVGRVLRLDGEHLFVDLLGRHAAAEEGGRREVAPVAGVGGAHHVLGVVHLERREEGGREGKKGIGARRACARAHTPTKLSPSPLFSHLLRQLRHRQRPVLLRPARGERGEADHEEVEARKRDEVDGELAQVGVQLAGEAQAAGDARHDGGYEVVEVAESGGGELGRGGKRGWGVGRRRAQGRPPRPPLPSLTLSVRKQMSYSACERGRRGGEGLGSRHGAPSAPRASSRLPPASPRCPGSCTRPRSPPVGAPTASRCRARQRCPRPSGRGPPKTSSSCGRGTPPESWR